MLKHAVVVEATAAVTVEAGTVVELGMEGDDEPSTYLVGSIEERRTGYDVISPGSPSKEDNARQEIPYSQPRLVAFGSDGWLLVANEALTSRQDRAILKAFVDDRGAPLAEPSVP